VTEQAAIFRRVICRKRGYAFKFVTISAEFFGLFFRHVLEAAVIGICGKLGRGLFRGLKQKQENSGTGEEKSNIQEYRIFFSDWGRIHNKGLWC